MDQALYTYETSYNGKDWKLDIVPDADAESPRLNQENLGVMVYNHPRYILGDRCIRQASMDEYLEEQGLDPSQVISLPLYLLDHSGLALSVNDFNDPWDSGCVGCIYTTQDKIKEAYGTFDDHTQAQALDALRQEVEQMHLYVSGQMCGYVLSSRPAQSDNEWEHEDSVWGFAGTEVSQNGMMEHLDEEWKSVFAPASKRTP